MNRLSNFGDFALTRSEMKGVRGGNCMVQTSGGPEPCPSLSDCEAIAGPNGPSGYGPHYCCASCGKASWCSGC